MRKPHILFVTPEITFLSDGMGNATNIIGFKQGGLADITAGLVHHLLPHARLSVIIPRYEKLIDEHARAHNYTQQQTREFLRELREEGVHVIKHPAFKRLMPYEKDKTHDGINKSIALQAPVINRYIEELQPDIIELPDWMPALINPAAKAYPGVKTSQGVHNIFTAYETAIRLERRGIDLEEVAQYLYWEHYPQGWSHDRIHNRIDFLATGIFASDVVHTVSPSFLEEIVSGEHEGIIPDGVRDAFRIKYEQGRARGILNAPEDSIRPEFLHAVYPYGSEDVISGKARNKRRLQEQLGLATKNDVPMIFWPNRLYAQKGPELFIEQLEDLIVSSGVQVVFVADGDDEITDYLARLSSIYPTCLAYKQFDEDLSTRAEAAADFIVMPSRYEPCGLPQMRAPRFGTLPIVRFTGGLRDTVQPLVLDRNTGNGFVFHEYSVQGLAGGIDEALRFYRLGTGIREQVLARVMRESQSAHTMSAVAEQYLSMYDGMLSK